MKQGYAVHHTESPEGKNLLALNLVTAEDLSLMISRYQEEEKTRIGTVLGINSDGLIASARDNWHPNLPDAFAKTFTIIPWVQILELLGRLPDGAVADLFSNKSQTKQ